MLRRDALELLGVVALDGLQLILRGLAAVSGGGVCAQTLGTRRRVSRALTSIALLNTIVVLLPQMAVASAVKRHERMRTSWRLQPARSAI